MREKDRRWRKTRIQEQGKGKPGDYLELISNIKLEQATNTVEWVVQIHAISLITLCTV